MLVENKEDKEDKFLLTPLREGRLDRRRCVGF